MALVGSNKQLSLLIKNAFKQAQKVYANSDNPDSEAYLNNLCDGIANAVISHIVANAQVTTTVTGTCSTGPITGVGTGTIK